MNRRIIALIAIALILSMGLLGTALAHAKLVSSDPAAGARLNAAPGKVTLVFSEEIDANQSSFTVSDAKGATVGTGKLDTNDLDHKTMSGTLNAGLGDGVYTVKWEAVTPDDDGHSEGSFTFGVNADPGAQPTAEPEPTEEAEPTAATAAQPTTAPASGAAQATPTVNLPQTGASGPDLSGYLLLGALIALVGGIALRGILNRARR